VKEELDFYFNDHIFIYHLNKRKYDLSCVEIVKETPLYTICRINRWTIWAGGKKPDDRLLELLPDEKFKELTSLKTVKVRFTDRGVFIKNRRLAQLICEKLKRELVENDGWFRIPRVGLVLLPKVGILPVFDVETDKERSVDFELKFELRDYQREALDNFKGRGLITWPTGAGKSFIGIAVIKKMGVPSLIVVPSVDLCNEWFSKFERYTDATKRGLVSNFSVSKIIKPITIMTYASAVKYLSELRRIFKLLVFDEAHHAPADSYIRIALSFPMLLTLTASPYREDNKEYLIYGISGGGIASYPWERFYREGAVKRPRVYFVKARREKVLKYVLDKFKDEKILVFIFELKDIDEVRRIGGKNFPVIHGRMTALKRQSVLCLFKERRRGVLIVSIAGNEGIDIPDARIGVVFSSLGGRREAVQRVGRLMRPKDKQPIVFYPYSDFDKVRNIVDTFRAHGFEVVVL